MKHLLRAAVILLALMGLITMRLVGSYAQEDPASQASLDITGVNATGLPRITMNASITNEANQAILGIGTDDLTLTGELAEQARIVSVTNVSDVELPVAIVLAIDTSSSMDGSPMEQAKASAKLFVEGILEYDEVAIVEFNSRSRVVQDFTSDKALALGAIDGLYAQGETALFEAGNLAIDVAAGSEIERRIVILLGDGANYTSHPEASSVDPQASFDNARKNGIAVYTVGLGFGADRSYLEALAQNSSGRFFESPSPEELTEIYGGIVESLLTEYNIIIETDAVGDGSDYDLGLRYDYNGVILEDSTSFRSPILIPQVAFEGLPADPLASAVSVGVMVESDETLTATSVTLDGEERALTDQSILLDPLMLAPGEHTLEARATDATGDEGLASATFTVAALAPNLSVSTALVEDANGLAVLQIDADTQGSQVAVETLEATFATLDPISFVPNDQGMASLQLQLVDLPAGENTLNVVATSANGEQTTQQTSIRIPSTPPTLAITGLEEGQELLENARVTVESNGQSAVTTTYALDGGEVRAFEGAFELDVIALGAGEHALSVVATDENGASSALSVAFAVSSLAIPTATPTHTPTDLPTATPTLMPTNVPTATAVASATRQVTPALEATARNQVAVDVTATLGMQATSNAQPTANAQSTVNAQATANTQATANAQATANTQATVNAQSTTNAQATADAQATVIAQDVVNAQAAGTAQATETAVANFTPTGGPREGVPTATSTSPIEVIEDGAVTEGRFANIIPYIVAGIVLVLVVLGLLFGRRR